MPIRKTRSSVINTSSLIKVATCSIIGYCSYLMYKRYKNKERIKSEWKGKNIARIKDVTLSEILDLFSVTLEMEKIVLNEGCCNLANGKLLTTIFYEPSTRTSCSFQAAMKRLGGKVLNISNIKSSSISKGESLEDTMKCLECYSDILVIRHPKKGTPQRIINACPNIPIINAGDGSGEHPTQALLDLFTIYKEKNNKINGLNITFIGDLKYGRTVHSLVPALSLFKDINIQFIAPKSLQIPQNILNENKYIFKKNNISIKQSINLSKDILSITDVMYVTRIQKERFESIDIYNKVKGCFIINNNVLNNCKKNMIIMHPLPRIDEIDIEIDKDPRAIYFKQMKYGMYVRMSLLALILGTYT